MENTAILQAGLLAASIFLYAVCLTTHNTGKVLIVSIWSLMFSTFSSFVCVRWIPQAAYTLLGLTFFVLAFTCGLVAYSDFQQPETNRIRTGAKLAYGFAAFLLFTLILWTFDNRKSQRIEKAIEHVSGQVDTIAAVAGANAIKITRLDTSVAKLAKNDTALTKTVEQTKAELWEKTDATGQKVSEKLDNLSLRQQRMNTNMQKQKRK
ncbi:hypothetical protein [Spirosoma areae]